MAQVQPFNNYEIDMPVALEGMKGDSTVDVVDSFAAEVAIKAGMPVIRGTDGAKQIKAASTSGDGAKVIGVAVLTHKEPEAAYPIGYSVPVMTFGDVYVKAGGTVTAGDSVALTISGGTASFVASSTSSAEAVSNMIYLDNGASGDLVRVRIRN